MTKAGQRDKRQITFCPALGKSGTSKPPAYIRLGLSRCPAPKDRPGKGLFSAALFETCPPLPRAKAFIFLVIFPVVVFPGGVQPSTLRESVLFFHVAAFSSWWLSRLAALAKVDSVYALQAVHRAIARRNGRDCSPGGYPSPWPVPAQYRAMVQSTLAGMD